MRTRKKRLYKIRGPRFSRGKSRKLAAKGGGKMIDRVRVKTEGGSMAAKVTMRSQGKFIKRDKVSGQKNLLLQAQVFLGETPGQST